MSEHELTGGPHCDCLQARIKELEVKAERYDWLSNNDARANWQVERELAVAETRIKELEGDNARLRAALERIAHWCGHEEMGVATRAGDHTSFDYCPSTDARNTLAPSRETE